MLRSVFQALPNSDQSPSLSAESASSNHRFASSSRPDGAVPGGAGTVFPSRLLQAS